MESRLPMRQDVGRHHDRTRPRSLRNPVVGLVHAVGHDHPLYHRIARQRDRTVGDEKHLQRMPFRDPVNLGFHRQASASTYISIVVIGNVRLHHFTHARVLPADELEQRARLRPESETVTFFETVTLLMCDPPNTQKRDAGGPAYAKHPLVSPQCLVRRRMGS